MGDFLAERIAAADDEDSAVARVRVDEEARLYGFGLAECEREDLPHHMTGEGTDWSRWPAIVEDKVLEAGSGDMSVVLSGATGLGKSHAACIILRARAFRGRGICRVKEFDFRNLYECLKYSDGRGFRAEVEKAKHAPVLLWEDFGKCKLSHDEAGESLTDLGSMVFEIFDYRAEQKKPVIVTTQYTKPDGLLKIAGRSLVRRAFREPLMRIELGEAKQ
jgi:hypothetical protein